MKSIILTLICVSFVFQGFSQDGKQSMNADTSAITDQDTIEIKTHRGKKKIDIIIKNGKEVIDEQLHKERVYGKEKSEHKPQNRSGLFGGLTFARFDIGLAKMLDHGEMELSAKNDFLRYRSWKSVNVGFDVGQVGYRFSDEFRILLSAGFDWTQFRLKNDVIINEDVSPLSYEESDIRYNKNRFGSSYLRIPLTFEIRSKAGRYPERFHFAAGPIVGILLQGNQKFKSDEEGKHKTLDDFNYATYRYGAFVRAGYDWFGLYAKYYVNDMFQNSPDQQDLKNVSFGLMFFF